MGGGPIIIPPGTWTGIAFGCLCIIAALVAIYIFVPWQYLVVAIAILAVFFSAWVVGKAFEDADAIFRAALTAVIQIAAVAVITLVMRGLERRWWFFTLAALMILVTQAGTAAVNSYREGTLAQLKRAKRVPLVHTQLFSSTLESRSAAYYGLVLGFGVGVVLLRLGVASRSPILPLLGALIGTVVLLLYEMVRNGMLMANPYDSLFEFEPAREDGSPSDEQLEDLAYSAAELRQTVFWSSVFAATIFLALSLLIVDVLAVEMAMSRVFVPTLFVLFLLVQAPYVCGQTLVHRKLAGWREGTQQGALRVKLQKLAPLYPTVPTLAALILPGTAGSVLCLGFVQVVKQLKPLF